jgi:hypothetical protein
MASCLFSMVKNTLSTTDGEKQAWLADLSQGWWFSATSYDRLLPPFATGPSRLRTVPDGIDDDAPRAHPVKHDIGSAADDQFANTRFGSSTTDEGIIPQNFNYGHDPGAQPFRGVRFISGYIGANLFQASPRPPRPDDL